MRLPDALVQEYVESFVHYLRAINSTGGDEAKRYVKVIVAAAFLSYATDALEDAGVITPIVSHPSHEAHS